MQARELLVGLCGLATQPSPGRPVALRVNWVGTDDFVADLAVARAVADARGLAAVLLSKVEAPEEVAHTRDALERASIRLGGVVPLIETQCGSQRAAAILAAAAKLGTPGAAFGYHDYCLDAGCWPFPRLRDKRYWEFAARIAAPALAAGLRCVHPPDPELRDEKLLGEMFARLRSLCGERFDVFSAGMTQTAALRRLMSEDASADGAAELPPLHDSPPLEDAERRRLAEETCAAFAENGRGEHSYATDARRGRFISPHEFLAAQNFLRTAGDA